MLLNLDESHHLMSSSRGPYEIFILMRDNGKIPYPYINTKFFDRGLVDTFDPDYRYSIVALSLGLSNLGKHLLLAKEHLQDLLVCFTFLVYFVSCAVSMDGDRPGSRFHPQLCIDMG
jgi:hypothetical protein